MNLRKCMIRRMAFGNLRALIQVNLDNGRESDLLNGLPKMSDKEEQWFTEACEEVMNYVERRRDTAKRQEERCFED